LHSTASQAPVTRNILQDFVSTAPQGREYVRKAKRLAAYLNALRPLRPHIFSYLHRGKAAERQRLIAQGTVRPDEEASSRPSGLLFVFGFSLLLLLLGLLLHGDPLYRDAHLLTVALRQEAFELFLAPGVSQLQPFLRAHKQNLFLCRIRCGARELDALGGGFAACVAVDSGHP